jgi:ELWxxDGT repeat protein
LVKDIQPGTGSGYPRDLLNVNGMLYFAADNGAIGEELWKSDGTASGTVLVHDLATGIGSSSPRGLIIAGSRLFAAATTDATGSELFSLNFAATSSFVSGFAIEGISSSSQAAAAVRSPELTGPGAIAILPATVPIPSTDGVAISQVSALNRAGDSGSIRLAPFSSAFRATQIGSAEPGLSLTTSDLFDELDLLEILGLI